MLNGNRSLLVTPTDVVSMNLFTVLGVLDIKFPVAILSVASGVLSPSHLPSVTQATFSKNPKLMAQLLSLLYNEINLYTRLHGMAMGVLSLKNACYDT